MTRRNPAHGRCVHCYKPAEPGRARCAVHLDLERKRSEARRRSRGQVPMAEYLAQAKAPPGPLTRTIIDAKLGTARCECGLLLPCWEHRTVDDYAASRPGSA